MRDSYTSRSSLLHAIDTFWNRNPISPSASFWPFLFLTTPLNEVWSGRLLLGDTRLAEILGKPGRLRKWWDIRVQIWRQQIDDRADVLEVSGHPCVVDIPRESICRPLVLSLERGEGKIVDRVPIVWRTRSSRVGSARRRCFGGSCHLAWRSSSNACTSSFAYDDMFSRWAANWAGTGIPRRQKESEASRLSV